MALLRAQAPRPLPRPRNPSYPRVLELGMLLLLGACSRSNETPQEVPPPPAMGGAVPAVMVDAALPQPAPMGSIAPPIVEAGAPEAGPADAGRDAGRDAGKRVTTSGTTRPPRTGGIPAHPFDEKDLY